MKIMMIMVIILMLDDDNAQNSSTTKYYYLVKKDQTNPPNGQCPFKNAFPVWMSSLSGAMPCFYTVHRLQFFVFLLLTMILRSCLSDGDESCRKVKGRNLFCLKISGNV